MAARQRAPRFVQVYELATHVAAFDHESIKAVVLGEDVGPHAKLKRYSCMFSPSRKECKSRKPGIIPSSAMGE